MAIDESTRVTNIRRLDDPAAIDATVVGSKAANLAALVQAGFPALDGVVIAAGLAPEEVRHDPPSPVIERIIETLGDGPLAVRSSGVAEDLVDRSFAGQYESVLDVRGRAALVAAIRTCLGSAGSERVQAYGGEQPGRGMAVLVQRMVRASAAGVAFSANPVTGARDEVVIDAVAGLADRLVAGERTPEAWVVKGESITSAPGVTAPGVSPTEPPALDAETALVLARLTRRIEIHFGRPQDVEWAIEDGSPIILQARPITTLANVPSGSGPGARPTTTEPADVEPIPIPIDVPVGFWEHDTSHFPAASYPIDSFVPGLVASATETWVGEFGYLFDGIEFREIGGWMYQRLRPLGGKDGPMLPTPLMWLLVRVMPVMRRRTAIAREAVRTDKAGRFIERWTDTWLPELADTIRELQAVDRLALSDAELDRHADDVIRLAARGIEVHTLVHGSLAPIMFEFVTACRELLGWDMAEAFTLLNGTSFKSTEPARRLHDLATMASARPAVLDSMAAINAEATAGVEIPAAKVTARFERIDPAFAAAYRDYVDAFGHRALGDSSAEPTIAERPSLILRMIRGQLDADFRPHDVDHANAAARDEALARARSRLAGDPTGHHRFEGALDRARDAYPAREDNEFYTLSAPFALVRYVVIEFGSRLAARGVIDAPDDVMYLYLDEAHAALADGQDRRSVVERRKSERAWAVANPGPASYGSSSPVPSSLSFLPSDARLPMESMLWSLESMMAMEASQTKQASGSTIRGTAAGAGSYTGPVRVVMGEWEFHKLRGGDVLVCPITSPVWSVLFPGLGALVTDSGGILSHPAIIAREYRIPAVVATGNATSLLRDGQIVTVDGATGTVTIAP